MLKKYGTKIRSHARRTSAVETDRHTTLNWNDALYVSPLPPSINHRSSAAAVDACHDAALRQCLRQCRQVCGAQADTVRDRLALHLGLRLGGLVHLADQGAGGLGHRKGA